MKIQKYPKNKRFTFDTCASFNEIDYRAVRGPAFRKIIT